MIRGKDHVSNTPSQINILRALGAELPVYAHLPNINGDDGKKLSKRRNDVSVDWFREEGYLPAALMNFLALLGWSYDDKTTIMSRHELIERFSLDRVVSSPAVFDYQKLDWMNGMYLREPAAGRVRALPVQVARRAGDRLAEGDRPRDGAARAGEDREVLAVPGLRPLPLRGRAARRVDPAIAAAARDRLRPSTTGTPPRSRRRFARLCDDLGQKPRQVFAPIRLAVTGSKISPGLFESLELLGRERSLARLSAAAS